MKMYLLVEYLTELLIIIMLLSLNFFLNQGNFCIYGWIAKQAWFMNFLSLDTCIKFSRSVDTHMGSSGRTQNVTISRLT